jgi:hypothetical protein
LGKDGAPGDSVVAVLVRPSAREILGNLQVLTIQKLVESLIKGGFIYVVRWR